jgi:DNA-binding CsgD family transcriptional regulator
MNHCGGRTYGRGMEHHVRQHGRLHGRSPELAELWALLDGADHRGAALFLAGEPGIGASALLDEVGAEAYRRDLWVLRLHGAAVERDIPYAGLQRLLIVLGVVAPVDSDPSDVSGRVVCGDHLSTLEPLAVASSTLRWLTRAAARRPLVLLVDDLHWLDRPTRRVLSLVARRLGGARVVMVAAARTPPDGGDLDDVPVVRRIPCLTREASVALLRERHPNLSPAAVGILLAHARGNPLALVDLPRAAARELAAPGDLAGPDVPMTLRLQRAFGGFLGELPVPTRLALLAAAVDPEADVHGVLGAASVVAGGPVTADALEPAVSASWVSVGLGALRFHHPLVRPALLASATTTERRRLHAAYALVCADGSRRQVWHRAQSADGPDAELASVMEATAGGISPANGPLAAARTMHRAAELSEDPQQRSRRLLLAAGHALSAGAAGLAGRVLDDVTAAPSTEAQDDHARLLQSWARGDGDHDAAAVSRLCRLAGHLHGAGDRGLALDVLGTAALRGRDGRVSRSDRRELVGTAQRLLADETGPALLSVLAMCSPMTYGRRLHALLADIEADRIVEAADVRILGMAAHVLGDPVRAVALLSAAVSRLHERGEHGRLPVAQSLLLKDAVVVGDWTLADATLADLGRTTDGASGWTGTDAALYPQAVLAALRGETDAAREVVVRLQRSPRCHHGDLGTTVQLAHGLRFLAGGHAGDGFAALRSAFLAGDVTNSPRDLYDAVPYLADAGRASGQVAEAVRALVPLEQVAELSAAPALHAGLRYARARLADDDVAEGRFHEALVPDLDRWPLMRARTQLAYGTWLRRQRRLSESRQPLLAAQATFEAIGATSSSDAAYRELRATGLRAGRDVSDVHAVLSAQESQIARLAADGFSNREIGERLYLSPRTVGSHLYRIFPKLDITSRAQLSAHLTAG